MKKMLVEVKVEETHLLKKVRKAQAAIRTLKEIARDFEFFNNGLSTKVEAKQQEIDERRETTTAFYVEINEETVKDQVAAVEVAMKPLMDAIEELDKAIIEGLTKNIPQE